MYSTKHSLHRPSRGVTPSDLRLERWQRRAVYLSIGLLSLSGLFWLVVHYFLRAASQFGETVNPLEPWTMKVHGAAAIVAWFVFGTMLNSHIRRALRSGRNRVSGWSMVTVIGLLTLSGYGLYYVASEGSRPFWSVAHWVTGVALGFGLLLHIRLGRRSRLTHEMKQAARGAP